MPERHSVVLVPERHREAVEAYLRDLETLDSDADESRAGDEILRA